MKYITLNDKHIALGAKMVDFAGFNMPVQYQGVTVEHETVRKGVGVFDVSHMGEFFVSGPNAINLLQKVSSNDVSKLKIGQAQYAYFPNQTGGIIDDFLTYRIDEEQFLLVVNASNIEKDWAWINQHNEEFRATIENASNDYSLFAVQGPKATQVLQKLTLITLSEIPYYYFQIGTLAGIENVILSCTGYTGSGGFEVYCKNEHAEYIWDKIFEAGFEEDIKPIGLAARDTLRLEMGFCLYGNDISDETSPFEAGLGWVTKFSKSFINDENLKKQKEQGVKQKLVGFELIDKGIPRHNYSITNGKGQEIGKVTSGTMSPSLKMGIGMGYVPIEYANIDSEIFIQIRNKELKATVVKTPFINLK